MFVGLVTAFTLAVRADELPLHSFAASAAKLAAGEIWLLPASALVVDRPVYVGLVTFAVLAATTLRICGTRVFWVAAALGHVGSTLAVYAIILMARLTDQDVFTSSFGRQDFGVSAIQGAWVGAIAVTALGWAGTDPRARALVAAGVCALAGVAWWLHPDPSILTTEHLVAFLIGCGVVSWDDLTLSARMIVAHLVGQPHRDATTTG